MVTDTTGSEEQNNVTQRDCDPQVRPEASARPSTPGKTALAVVLGGVSLVLVWYLAQKLGRVIGIFAAGYLVAYVSEPLITLLQRRGLQRMQAIGVVLAGLVVGAGLLAWAVVPRLVSQVQDVADNWPIYSDRAEAVLTDWRLATEIWLVERYPETNVTRIIDERIEAFEEWAGAQAPLALEWASGQVMTLLALVGLGVIVLIISFHFMKLKGRFEAGVKRLIPSEHSDDVSEIGSEIAAMLGRYVRSMVVLSLLIGGAMWLAISVVGLVFGSKYALIVGCIACFAHLIPYIGSFVNIVTAGVLTYITAAHDPAVAAGVAMATVFGVDQFFDLIVRPNLIGRRIDLNPIIAFFSVLAGFKLLGFVGMLIGMPVAASIKIVLARWIPVIGPGPGVRAPNEPLLLDVSQVASGVWKSLKRFVERLGDNDYR